MLSSTKVEMKPKLTPKLAEFIGMHVGDGTLYKTNSNSLVWEQRGDLKEKDYYDQHVFPLLNNLFDLEKKPKFRSGGKNGCYGIQTSNKKLISTLIEFGINPGKKIRITVPKEIMNATNDIKKSFLRGYFDTDGCIRFERINKRTIADYPKIEFSSISKDLRDDVCLLLEQADIKPNKWDIRRESGNSEFKMCISGKKKVFLWINQISSHNPKHLKKFTKFDT
jgi:hypothetical protein